MNYPAAELRGIGKAPPYPSVHCANAALRVPRSEGSGAVRALSGVEVCTLSGVEVRPPAQKDFLLPSRRGEGCHEVTGRGQLYPGVELRGILSIKANPDHLKSENSILLTL
jgi:hypothetical protein